MVDPLMPEHALTLLFGEFPNDGQSARVSARRPWRRACQPLIGRTPARETRLPYSGSMAVRAAPPVPQDDADEPLGREVWVVSAVVTVGVIMSILDTTIVNVALETLSR